VVAKTKESFKTLPVNIGPLIESKFKQEA